MTTKEKVRNGAIFAIADHYKRTVSTGSVQIEVVKQLSADDWRVQATCRRLTDQRISKVLHVELIIDCDDYKFDLLSFYEIGASK